MPPGSKHIYFPLIIFVVRAVLPIEIQACWRSKHDIYKYLQVEKQKLLPTYKTCTLSKLAPLPNPLFAFRFFEALQEKDKLCDECSKLLEE